VSFSASSLEISSFLDVLINSRNPSAGVNATFGLMDFFIDAEGMSKYLRFITLGLNVPNPRIDTFDFAVASWIVFNKETTTLST
jgi:phage-related holin